MQKFILKNAFSNKGIIRSIDSIKESIKKQTGSDSAPTHIKFSELVEKRLSRIKYNKLLMDLFEEIEDTKINSLGKLPQKGEVQIESVIKVLPETEVFSTESLFDKNGLPARRKLMKNLIILILALVSVQSINILMRQKRLLM